MKKFKNDLEIAKYLLKIEKQAFFSAKKQKMEVADKKAHDLVTNYDTFVEKFLVNKLKSSFGDVKIVSEEFNSTVSAEGDCFVIDPIDGTVNFANNLHEWGVQVAYMRENETKASAIFMPHYGGFFAAKGFGSFMNGKRLECEKRDLKHSLLCVDYNDVEKFSATWKKLAPYVLQQRFTGAACMNFTLLAQGKVGVCVISENANPWDKLPGLLVATEAGCVSKVVSGHCVVATTSENAETIAEALKDVTFKKAK